MSDPGNVVVAAIGRRLRLGVVGGGPGSFIGPVHRAAARLDDRYEVVASVLSSDPERARAGAAAAGVAPERAYLTVDEMLATERSRPDGVDVVAVMTPNHLHHPVCRAVLDAGLHVICDKPLTTCLDDALDLVTATREANAVFCLTHNYSGYPMVREARALVRAGVLGEVRQVHVLYAQGQLASYVEPEAPERLRWRLDPARGGPSPVLGDIGTHAHQLVTYITGEQVVRVAADVGPTVPGRSVDDYAGMLLRLEGGGRGVMWVTQAAAGTENALEIRIHGARGGLEWVQNQPNQLKHAEQFQPARILSRGQPGLSAAARRASRIPLGHPEGFHEAFANLYIDASEAIAARIAGGDADPLALDYPTVEDGARGMRFVEAALASRDADGAWVGCSLSLDGG